MVRIFDLMYIFIISLVIGLVGFLSLVEEISETITIEFIRRFIK